MEPVEQPDRLAARDALDQITDARHAAARATRRPAWIDLGFAATLGAAVTLALAGLWVPALAVLLVGAAGFTIVQRVGVRRHGQVMDRRALGARGWRFPLAYGVLFLIAQIDPPAAWQPWYSIAAGLVAAAVGYGWLRWEDRYQTRRLAAGDYHRNDLL